MVNLSNYSFFEGRISSDIETTQIQGQNGSFDKVNFSIVVDRALTSQQRQAVKNGDQSIKTADFIRCSAIGSTATLIKDYFTKGKAIKVICTYNTFETINQQTGQKNYGHNFNVEQVGFPTQDAKYLNNNGNNQQNNGQQNNNFNNNGFGFNNQQNNSQQNPQMQNAQGNFSMFDSTEGFPFN